MIREIIKDGEDMEGDREYECQTMPIVWGEVTSKIVVSTLVVIAVGLLLWCVNRWIVVPDPSAITVRYALFGNAIPAACLLVLLWSNSCVAYKNASHMSKFIMLIGLLYLPVHYYFLASASVLPMFGLFKVV